MASSPLPNLSPKLVCLPLLLALAVAATLLYAPGLNVTRARGTEDAVRDGQTALALRLVKHLAPASGDGAKGNVVFSPVSIHGALSLVAAGARGATLDQMLAFLGAPSAEGLADFGRRVVHRVLAGDQADSGGPSVLFTGGICVDASSGGLKKAFRDLAVEAYKSVARSMSFAKPEEVAEVINSWAKKATSNLIDSIVSAADIAGTDLVLANAVYFKAKWRNPFKEYNTHQRTFHRLDGSRVDAQFMSQTMHDAQYVSSVKGFKVLKLPYKHDPDAASDTQFSMYIFLPNERQGIATMVDAITAGPRYLYNVLRKTAKGTVTVTLPKFELSYDWDDLGGDLRQLGLSLPFSPESADLSGIFEETPTSLSKVLHKAVVKVDEDGTEAAAVTVGLMLGSAWQPEPPVEFVADHPFTFFIMEEQSGIILFAGHVLDPTK